MYRVVIIKQSNGASDLFDGSQRKLVQHRNREWRRKFANKKNWFGLVPPDGDTKLKLCRNIPVLHEGNFLDFIIFMQDGAPPHVARTVMQLLRTTFAESSNFSNVFHFLDTTSSDL